MGPLSWWIEGAAGMGLLSWWIEGAAGMGLLSWWIEGAAGLMSHPVLRTKPDIHHM
jgi:hypothetical protein